MESPLPHRQTCCFWCSSRKSSGRKSKPDRSVVATTEAAAVVQFRKAEEEAEILSDVSTFSLKEQQRRLKIAVKEEGAAIREAERVVEWVKQASARIDTSVIDKILDE